MIVNKAITKDYENKTLGQRGKNEPNTNPNEPNLSRRSLWRRRIKANLKKAQINVNKVLTKDYEKMSNWTLYENEPNSNPKRTQFIAA